ncbi:MAG: O-antigen ligase family protein [Oscillospiraceae bacterium]
MNSDSLKNKFIQNKNAIWQYLFCFLIMISLCLMFQVKVGFTNSGIISFYGSEIVGIIVGIYTLIYAIKNKRELTRDQKYFVGFTMLFAVFCAAVYLIRFFKTGIELKSILIIESNFFIIGFMFMIIFKKIEVKRAIKSISIFGAVFGVVSVVLFYTYQSAFVENMIFHTSNFNILTFGHAVRTYLLTMIFPISAYNYIKSNDKFSATIYYIHLITISICGLLSASRINYVFIPLVIIATSFIISKKNKKNIKKAVLYFVAALLFVFLSSPFFIQIYAQLTRIPITNQVMTTCKIPYIGFTKIVNSGKGKDFDKQEAAKVDKEKIKELIDAAEKSPEQSSSMRFSAWKQAIEDIKKAPLMGIGLQQYECVSNDGILTVVIQPHNFILEYVLSFGILGFLLWTFMIASPVFLSFKKIKFKFWENKAASLMVCSMLFACAGAFFQPYFIYSSVMTFVYLILGCFYTSVVDES